MHHRIEINYMSYSDSESLSTCLLISFINLFIDPEIPLIDVISMFKKILALNTVIMLIGSSNYGTMDGQIISIV